jgi:hypothetical protein
MIFFYIYITIDNILFIFLVIFIFCSICLVQLCVILVRNGMFNKKTKSSNLVTKFYYVIDTVYIYSWKKLKTSWPILVILYVKSIFFLSHVVFNLTMEWTPPWAGKIRGEVVAMGASDGGSWESMCMSIPPYDGYTWTWGHMVAWA